MANSTFNASKARAAVERFQIVLGQVKASDPDVVESLQAAWRLTYLDCGHKALGRLMCGKSVDEACKSFRKE